MIVTGVALVAVSALVVAFGWWKWVEPRWRRYSGADDRRSTTRIARSPFSDNSSTLEQVMEIPPELTADWADRGQVWPALKVENALLAERLAGRLGAADYRRRLAELAWRCEPASDEPASDDRR
ncbi:hypothetical protein IU501_19645 [Nocardia otitidiscaviarum]|uniref:hypothetical protein n=1 Tax=Nocardia otitidiscaviarum TaxID=1823 RepID=UPI0004A75D54|nr:hypothetical protein [Nocardia otitidiscaviarum]MBF6135201.1 hypothetical protein [Nocardia otitidiscaviarum]MBF6487022.1 hypothetical protein [Nocardia otitidiscaviarum]